MNRRFFWIIIGLLLVTALAACGGNNGSEPPPAMNDAESATATPDLRPTFPPTWTPAPSPSVPPTRPTLDYQYTRPTQPTFIPPTYTPSPVPPTPTPSPTRPSPTPGKPVATSPPVVEDLTLTVSASALSQAAQGEFNARTLPFLLAPPQFTLQPPDGVIALVNILTDPSDPNSGATVVIRVMVRLQEGRVSLAQVGANLLGDTNPYESPLIDTLLGALETRTNEAVNTQFTTTVPDGISFTILGLTVSSSGLQVDIEATRQQDAPPPPPVSGPSVG